jgi:hypothetical protein
VPKNIIQTNKSRRKKLRKAAKKMEDISEWSQLKINNAARFRVKQVAIKTLVNNS